MNSEYTSLRGSNGGRIRRTRASSGVLAALAVVARLAGGDEVLPRVGAAAVARHHVVEGEVVAGAPAVLARVAVAGEDLATGQLDARPRPADVVLEADHGRGAVDLADRADLGVVVLDDLGLRAEQEPERPRDVADVEGLVVLVQHEHDAVHGPHSSRTVGAVRIRPRRRVRPG